MPLASLSIKSFPRPLIYVILAAVIVRIVYAVIYASMPDWEMLTVDNYYHKHWAEDMASGNIWGDTTYFRAPFYVYCLSILFAIFGSSLWAARIFGMLVGIASITLTYQISCRLFNQRVAVIASAIQILFPAVLYFESELLLDALFMLLLELAFYRFIIWYDDDNSRNSFWLGLSLGLAAITRPTMLIFVLPVIAIALLRRNHSQSRLKDWAFLALGLLFLILPITIRNALVGKEFVLIASQGGINFYVGNNSSADGLSAVLPEPLGHNWRISDITYIAEKEMGKNLKPGQVSAYWFKRAVSEIMRTPLESLKLFCKKIYFNFSNREISNNRNLTDFFSRHPLLKYNPLSFGLVFSLAVLAVFTGWRAHWGIKLIIISIVIYVLAVSLFFFNSRFRLPALPLYFILAAAGIESLVFRFRESRWSIVLPLVVATTAAAFSFSPLVPLRSGAPTQHLTQRGLNSFAHKRFVEALNNFKKAWSADSTFPEINLNLGAAYFRVGLVDSAWNYFQSEERLHPGRASTYNNIASIYLIRGQLAEAIIEVEKALKLKPYGELSQLIRIRAASELIAVMNTDSLYSLTLTAIEQSGNAIEAVNYSSVTLSVLGALPQAKALLAKALEMRPPPIEINDDAFSPNFPDIKQAWYREKARTHYQLGFIYGTEGNISESILQSQKALAIDSNLMEAYINLANGFNAAGRFSEADSIMSIYRNRFPNGTLPK